MPFVKKSPDKPARRIRAHEKKQASTQFLSRIEIAQLLGCHVITVKEYEKNGKLTPFRFSQKMVRYPAAEVQKLIEEARARCIAK